MNIKETYAVITSDFVEAAHAFRLGQEAEGSQRLREGLDLLEPLLSSHPKAQVIFQLIPNMLAAQERHDWLGLADYLEHELSALLSQT
ncbi:hypothetical protein SHLO109777_11265 [Shewanella loihica]|uniref:Uncharacterized protein n=1 Tax=Shewanella loihica (strain ATCC BAA-1088 / PV-4) TaxID=323850 RepID=A3QCK6_SHELP|nr:MULTISPECIES: hypothetical protein [Shewanella]ABO23204.1 conserved hypothetical protein [Shewanella loihica PV-4]